MAEPGRGGGDAGAEDDRGRGVGRRHLHDAEVVADREVGVLAPAERRVELLGPVDVGHGQDHDLEPEAHGRGVRGLGRGLAGRRWWSWWPPVGVAVDDDTVPRSGSRRARVSPWSRAGSVSGIIVSGGRHEHRLRRDRHRRRLARRALRGRARRGRPARRGRGARAGRRRVLVLRVHPVQDAAASRRGGPGRARGGRDGGGRRRGGARVSRLHGLRLLRRRPGALAGRQRHRPDPRRRPARRHRSRRGRRPPLHGRARRARQRRRPVHPADSRVCASSTASGPTARRPG